MTSRLYKSARSAMPRASERRAIRLEDSGLGKSIMTNAAAKPDVSLFLHIPTDDDEQRTTAGKSGTRSLVAEHSLVRVDPAVADDELLSARSDNNLPP